ncbi:hypothetical protein [uncultured Roseivirga sp.]|uniref:hypothetical protein n=1 Tax=uncultured Roseivirga sp. TaxID=543088 RepID=UPI0030DA9E6E|tara:strand:- start:94621 stop:94893 length:273 start_codon:yes stop_codon:yes gene_type:complete
MGRITIERELPIEDDGFDYRNHLFSLLTEYLIKHTSEACKNLPEENELHPQFQSDSLWKDEETQTWIASEMKMIEQIAVKVIEDMNTPNI